MLREWTVENGSDYVIAGFCQREKKKKKKKKKSNKFSRFIFILTKFVTSLYEKKKKTAIKLNDQNTACV